ncbi:MAG: O-antigen ligase family protein [Terracidiphilus sp.]
MGLGLSHYIPLVAYIGFWIMCLVSLGGKPKWGLYYLIPFLPYRSMRDHFLDYPVGENMLTFLLLAVIIGAIIHAKKLPRSTLFLTWLVIGVYLYVSMWMGAALGNAPPPLWLADNNFLLWKSYMMIPLVFIATSMVIEDRKDIKIVIILTAITLIFIDRSAIGEAMQRSWANFDEDKRDVGPLAYGSNLTAAFLAQFAMFFWGLVQFVKNRKFKLLGYGLIGLTLFGTMYTFSRGAYAAALFSVLVLGLLKDRKLLIVLGVFLLSWQALVPNAVRERVTMTTNANGTLEASAQSRVDLWHESWDSIIHSPIVGNGYATFSFAHHVHDLDDTHNWYVLVMVEQGIIGLILALILFGQLFSTSFRLFRKAQDPLFRGLGLGLFLTMSTSLVANCFGDRWTYLEISGLLFVLFGAAVRATRLMELEQTSEAALALQRAPAIVADLPALSSQDHRV